MRFFVIFTLVLLWFLPLEYRDLIRPDEGRYAEIAREIWINHNWITPTLNGLHYFEKPPLQYWATSLFFHIFEPAAWTARLWPAITGFSGILLTLWLGKQLQLKLISYFAALIQISTILYVGSGHFNTLDMSLCFFLQLTLFGYIKHYYFPQHIKSSAWIIGIGIAGAFLSKGLIAIILPGTVFIIDSIWHQEKNFWKISTQSRIWGIAFLLSLPWCIAVSIKNPGFAYFFFIHEHFDRFTTPSHHREGPIYYFIPILLIGFLPWTFIWIQSLKNYLTKIKQSINKNKIFTQSTKHSFDLKKHTRLQRIFIIWSITIFIFFSVSHSKLPSYILPIFPTMAWLLAFSLERYPHFHWRKSIIASLVFWITVLIFAPLIKNYISNEWSRELYKNYYIYLYSSLLCMIIGCFILLASMFEKNLSFSSQEKLKFWYWPILLWSLGIQFAFQGYQAFSPQQSIKILVNQVLQQEKFKKEFKFYSVNTYDQTLDFYINRTTTLVNIEDEMEFGCKQKPSLCIKSIKEWETLWLNEKNNAYAILPTKLYEEYYKTLPMQLLGKNQRHAIIKRFNNIN
ncbi:MAG: glycosyltransferase family 39 protein [Pseudomonadota bacterium]